MLAALLLGFYLASPLPLRGTLPAPVPLDSARLTSIADSLLVPWRESGHLLARIDLAVTSPDLSWSVTPGPFLQWRSARSSGDSIFSARALAHLSGLKRGAAAAPSDLERAATRLTESGCAELTGPPEPRGLIGTTWADAWFPLRRLPCSEAEAAAGWDQQQGFQGNVTAKLSNILGSARQARLTAIAGIDETQFSFLWREPWIGSLDVGLDLALSLNETTLESRRTASLEARLPWKLGHLLLGLETWTDIVRSDTTDSAVTTRVSAVGSRFGWQEKAGGRGFLAASHDDSVAVTSLQTFRDAHRLLFRGDLNLLWRFPLNPWSSLQLHTSGRSLWPLDTLTATGETRSLGGAGNWKGHAEGQFPSPRWLTGEAEMRLGTDSWGTAVFASPGTVWLLHDSSYRPHFGWGAGMGFFWSRLGTDVRLDLAAGEGTRSWDEAYLHLVFSNRF